MAILGIDLGTSSVKVIVLDTQGRTLSVSKANYTVMAPQPGWSESDPNEWWSAMVSAVQSAMVQVPRAEITAIGLSGQMHGVVLTDEEGLPVRTAMLWADTRAQAELEQYRILPHRECSCERGSTSHHKTQGSQDALTHFVIPRSTLPLLHEGLMGKAHLVFAPF